MDDSFLRIREPERADAVSTVVAAFEADPAEPWLYPDAAGYARWFPLSTEAFGGKAFDERTAWRLEDLSAVAFWLPPGVAADGAAIGELRWSTRPACRPTSRRPTRVRSRSASGTASR